MLQIQLKICHDDNRAKLIQNIVLKMRYDGTRVVIEAIIVICDARNMWKMTRESVRVDR